MIKYPKMFRISEHVVNFMTKAMKGWREELLVWGKRSSKGKSQRGIFQEDSLRLYFFLQQTMQLNPIQNNYKRGYKFQEYVKQPMYRDYIKIFVKRSKNLI